MRRLLLSLASTATLGLALAAPGITGTASAASADTSGATGTTFQADLAPLNNSGTTGTVMIALNGDMATVWVKASGEVKGQPHAAHIHIDGMGICPDTSADTNHDGIISTVEGQPAYGKIGASLTTTGDTSPASALALDRFSTAPNGSMSYSRVLTLTPDVVSNIKTGKAVVVIHGIDANHDGKYDGSAKSQLDPSLPLEATAPAACGVMRAAQMSTVPSGGAQTGGGSTAGLQDTGLFAVGGALLLAAAGLLVARRRALAGS